MRQMFAWVHRDAELIIRNRVVQTVDIWSVTRKPTSSWRKSLPFAEDWVYGTATNSQRSILVTSRQVLIAFNSTPVSQVAERKDSK